MLSTNGYHDDGSVSAIDDNKLTKKRRFLFFLQSVTVADSLPSGFGAIDKLNQLQIIGVN
jgi:hypothetical protein